jgi:hypothetical protein
MEYQKMLDIATLFHSLLFAYQKSMKEILGTGDAILFHPVIEAFTKLERGKGLRISLQKESLDEALTNFSKFLSETGVVKEYAFQKTDQNKYVLKVNGCMWATRIHKELKMEDVICPFALMSMAIFQQVTGKKVKVVDSRYNPTGSETMIEPMS